MFFRKNTGGIACLIVGLGNPGPSYVRTRHNAGFCAVDAIAKEAGVTLWKLRFHAQTAEATVGGVRCLLMKPQTFMNLSGQAVSEAMRFYKLDATQVLILFDDISLPVGGLRIRRKGTHGGHNGMKNIISCTGREDFPRIKLGVGAKPHPDYDLADWVLSVFRPEEQTRMQEAYDRVPALASLIVAGKIDAAMQQAGSQ